jgi:glucose uptake protein GlcU
MAPMGVWEHVAQGTFGMVAALVGLFLKRKSSRYFYIYLLGWVALLLILVGVWYSMLHATNAHISN